MIKGKYIILFLLLLIVVIIIYRYNQKDNLIEVKNFRKSIEVESYFFLGVRVWAKTKLINYYDQNGRIAKVSYRDKDSTNVIYSYNSSGNISNIIALKKGRAVRIDSSFYDSLNRVILNKKYSIGLKDKMYLQQESIKEYYDNDSLKYDETIQYNQLKEKIHTTKTLYKYNSADNEMEELVTGESGQEYRLKYKYDQNGLLISKTDGFLGDTLLYSYINGKLNEVFEKSDNDRKLKEKFWYDGNGNMVKNYIVLDGKALEYEFEYDKYNRVVKKSYPENLFYILKPYMIIKYE